MTSEVNFKRAFKRSDWILDNIVNSDHINLRLEFPF